MGREVTDKRVIEMIGCRLHCIVEQMKAGLFNSNEKKTRGVKVLEIFTLLKYNYKKKFIFSRPFTLQLINNFDL